MNLRCVLCGQVVDPASCILQEELAFHEACYEDLASQRASDLGVANSPAVTKSLAPPVSPAPETRAGGCKRVTDNQIGLNPSKLPTLAPNAGLPSPAAGQVGDNRLGASSPVGPHPAGAGAMQDPHPASACGPPSSRCWGSVRPPVVRSLELFLDGPVGGGSHRTPGGGGATPCPHGVRQTKPPPDTLPASVNGPHSVEDLEQVHLLMSRPSLGGLQAGGVGVDSSRTSC
eukprot:gene17803-24181_t